MNFLFGGVYTPVFKVTVPDYFPSFSCKCGACRSVCCRGWRIALSEDEYFRLLGMPCAPTLRSRMDLAFRMAEEPSPERYAYVAPDYQGNCRLLEENGFCALHADCGEASLPLICRLYPRSFKGGENPEGSLSGSCEATVELLMRHEKPLSLISVPLELPFEEFPLASLAVTEIHRQVRTEAIRILQNRALTLTERLQILGKQYGISETSSTKPLRYLPILQEMMAMSVTLRETKIPETENLFSGVWAAEKEKFDRNFPDAPIWYENLLVNHMLYTQFPYCDSRLKASECFEGLYTAYVLLRVLTVFRAKSGKQEDFADAAADAFRYIEHTAFYRNAYVMIRKNNANSK